MRPIALRLLAVLLPLLLLPNVAHAQEPGTRVRVRAPSVSPEWLPGVVLRVDSTTLFLTRHSHVLELPLESVTQMEVAAGRLSGGARLRHLRRGLVTGLVTGVLLGGAWGLAKQEEQGSWALRGAGAGLVFGGVVGGAVALSGGERWEPAPLPITRRTLSLAPGGFRLGLSLRVGGPGRR